jgi:putative spermidine/putrescine transport system substrate-binding protein
MNEFDKSDDRLATTRRTVLGAIGALAAGGVARAGAATAPALPSSPVALNIVDVAGNLQLTQKGFEAYAAANPKLVSHISFTQATAPELPGKIKAQQDANRVDIDLVLSGNDGLAAGIEENLWEKLLDDYAAALPNLGALLTPMATRLQTAAQNQAVIVAACPGGPIFEYMPDKVKQPPGTAAELMAWCKANPKRFMYARPANSGPGRAFMMGLPYILGDKNPKDPINGWDKTWAYLAEIGTTIEYYPTGTASVFKELGDGTRDIVASHVGWDINTRVLGVVPKEASIFTLKGFHWVADSHFMCVPKGLPPGTLAVVLDLIGFMLKPPQQALTYDKGYFYPGPVVNGVTLAMAPKESQDAINEYGRPEYAKLFADNPVELPLDAKPMVAAFQRWDQQVGSKVAK